jgi:membrane protein implicated in regulation of membrane protease activity
MPGGSTGRKVGAMELPGGWIAVGLVAVLLLCSVALLRVAPAPTSLPAPPARRAVALTDLSPTGIVRYGSEEWSATADAGLPPVLLAASGQAGGLGGGHATTNRLGLYGRQPVPVRAGDAVEVVAVEGLQLRVRRIAVIVLPSMEVRD